MGKQFIGIERHEPYFDMACQRIAEAQRSVVGRNLRHVPDLFADAAD